MTTAALKKNIKALVDSDEVPSNELQASMNEQVARAEADFKAGRFYSGDEAYRRIKLF